MLFAGSRGPVVRSPRHGRRSEPGGARAARLLLGRRRVWPGDRRRSPGSRRGGRRPAARAVARVRHNDPGRRDRRAGRDRHAVRRRGARRGRGSVAAPAGTGGPRRAAGDARGSCARQRARLPGAERRVRPSREEPRGAGVGRGGDGRPGSPAGGAEGRRDGALDRRAGLGTADRHRACRGRAACPAGRGVRPRRRRRPAPAGSACRRRAREAGPLPARCPDPQGGRGGARRGRHPGLHLGAARRRRITAHSRGDGAAGSGPGRLTRAASC